MVLHDALGAVAMGSVALAPETFGLSIVVGAGIGALFGLGAWAVSKMSHYETKKEEAPPPPSYKAPEAIINNKVVTQ